VALNAALRDMDDNVEQISIFVDTDTVMLQRGWDGIVEYIIGNCDIFGCAYEDIGGYSSGFNKPQTYKRLPAGAWMAFGRPNKVRWSELDMSLTDDRHLIEITTAELSHVYNLPIGYSVTTGEAGWKIPQFIHDHHLTYSILIHAKPTKNAKAVLTSNDYHEEHQLLDGTPFVAHQRGSRKHVFRSHPMSAPFYKACEAYINKRT
jgi:hypothetical protein